MRPRTLDAIGIEHPLHRVFFKPRFATGDGAQTLDEHLGINFAGNMNEGARFGFSGVLTRHLLQQLRLRSRKNPGKADLGDKKCKE